MQANLQHPTLRYRRPGDIKRTLAKGYFEWRRKPCWQLLLRRERKPAEILTYLRRFKGFIGFHGCRPIDVRPYYAKGIKLADHEELTAIARRIFVSPEFPEIRSEEFDLIT